MSTSPRISRNLEKLVTMLDKSRVRGCRYKQAGDTSVSTGKKASSGPIASRAARTTIMLLCAASISLGQCLAAAPGSTVAKPARANNKAQAAHHAPQTALATGNGFGFATVSPATGAVNGYWAHPYKYERSHPLYKHPTRENEVPNYPIGEGYSTANFILSMSWKPEGKTPDAVKKVDYLQQSHMVTTLTNNSRQTTFMPFSIDRNVLITSWQPLAVGTGNAYLSIDWAHPVRSHATRRISGLDVRLIVFDGIKEALLLLPLDDYKKIKGRSAQGLSGHSSWALVPINREEDAGKVVAEVVKWIHNRAAEQIIANELAEVEHWRALEMAHFDSENELKLWRQSEIILRMAQCREGNTQDRHNNGLIMATLPDSGLFCPWVRDMAYATFALIRMGHQKEARMALDGYLNAQPVGKMQSEVGGYPYQVSVVRYFGNGEEEPYFTNEGADNIELDNWGLVLWAIGEYVDHYRDYAWLNTETYRGTAFENAKTYIMKPLLANLEPYKDGLIVKADTSIWEEQQKNKKHFAYTTAVAIAGLKKFDKIVERQGDEALHQELKRNIALLEKGFNQAFVVNGRLRGTLEEGVKNDADGANLEAINFAVVDNDEIVRATIDNMKALKVASGGYRRVTSIETDPRVFEYWYERQEFLFVDFNLADAYFKIERPDAASKLIDPIVTRAARDHNRIPEMYVSEKNPRFKGEIGDPTGAIPMVGYGAGAFINYILERESRGYGPARIHRH